MRRDRNPEEPVRRRRRGPRGAVALLTLLLIAAVAVAALFGTGVLKTVSANITAFGLRDMGELATQAGYFTSVQNIRQAREFLGITIPGSQSNYVFSYDGVIRAGLDFRDIGIRVEEPAHIIRITLPEIRILSVEIDENSFRLYNDGENIFTPLRMEDVNQAMTELKNKARETALANGILENARTNAEQIIRAFLAGCYDLNVYTIVFEDAGSGGNPG